MCFKQYHSTTTLYKRLHVMYTNITDITVQYMVQYHCPKRPPIVNGKYVLNAVQNV